MGLKLRLSTGKCACSNCYQEVKPTASFCDSCETLLEGEMDAKSCPSCETLINIEEKLCPICNEKLPDDPNIANDPPLVKELAREDKEFLAKIMGWAKSWGDATSDTEEDLEERDRAMKVLQSIATVESDEVMDEHIREIEVSTIEQEGFEKRRKQLIKLGRPFETLLERNTASINEVEEEIKEKTDEMMRLEVKKDENYDEKRMGLEKRIKLLQKKKATLMSYESSILMIGGSYRSILNSHQNELLRLEADLKKRVDAFQKEVERRKKQKEKLNSREEALDKREEELSHRFLDLKSRENEIKAREDSLNKTQKDLEMKEQELNTWEQEIDLNRNPGGQIKDDSAQTGVPNKEEWLAAQRRFQADIFGLKDGRNMGEQQLEFGEGSHNTTGIKDKKEIDEVLEKLEDLQFQIQEKDREIENLKDGETEFQIDDETRKILKILDDLLEKLPDDIIDKFAKSDEYLLYERVLEKYKL